MRRFAEPLTDDEMNKLIERQGEVQEKLDHLDAWDLDSRLEMAMDALRCPPGETRSACSPAARNGGWRSAGCSCKSPDILLLDEPTNHLDAETVAWLEHHLQNYAGTVIAVTHDRYFLDNVAGWILELDRGEGIPWKGNYSSWLEQKENRLATEEKQESERQQDPAARAGVDQDVPKGPPRQRRRRASPPMSSCCPRRVNSAPRTWRYTFRPDRAWATSSSRRTT